MRAIVLLSGGLDSGVTLARAHADGCECFALSVRYGQRHSYELECAARLAAALGASRHRIIDLDLAGFGGSSLLGSDGVIPKDAASPGAGGIPTTYVPARNTIFLSLALAWAEVLDAGAIYLGVNAIDYSGYPDCRPEFLAAFSALAAVATKAATEGRTVEIRAPLLHASKADIVRLGVALEFDFGLTSSCYDPGPEGAPCHRCDSCVLRARGFAEAGVLDPVAAQGGIR